MKKGVFVLFVVSLILGVFACEDDETTSIIGGNTGLDGNDGLDTGEIACEEPSTEFAGRCCSVLGTEGGMCGDDQRWISIDGCNVEYYVDGMQYCCGGRYLPGPDAFGFQCVGVNIQ